MRLNNVQCGDTSPMVLPNGSKSRIKRLRGLRQPQYRLRVDKARIYYDVDDSAQRVEVLGITLKEQSDQWLSQQGVLE